MNKLRKYGVAVRCKETDTCGVLSRIDHKNPVSALLLMNNLRKYGVAVRSPPDSTMAKGYISVFLPLSLFLAPNDKIVHFSKSSNK